MACKVPYFCSDAIMVSPGGGKERRFGKFNDGYDGYERVCLTRGEFVALARVVCGMSGDIAWSSSKHHKELERVQLIRKGIRHSPYNERRTYFAVATRLGQSVVRRSVEAFVKMNPTRVSNA